MSLCFFKDCNGLFRALSNPYASLWILIGPCGSFCILKDFNGSLEVLMRLYGF